MYESKFICVYIYLHIYMYMRLMEPHGNDCMEKYLYMQAGGSWGCIVKQSSSDTTFFSMQAEISIVVKHTVKMLVNIVTVMYK